jgi:hypothetical protein
MDIYASLGFSVPIYFGHPIDIKMHSHESLGQRDHNDTTCTQFGLRAFRHGNSCISRVSARFFYRHPIDMKMHLHKSLGQRDHNDTTYTQFGLQAFWHGNPCISRVSAQFFSGHLIDPKIILNDSLGQHDQNDTSHTQIRPQTRKLSLIEVLTFRVHISLNVHAYIGLSLTHACQKCFWKGKKISFSAHACSTMYGQKG